MDRFLKDIGFCKRYDQRCKKSLQFVRILVSFGFFKDAGLLLLVIQICGGYRGNENFFDEGLFMHDQRTGLRLAAGKRPVLSCAGNTGGRHYFRQE
jgi:hypothetical protein